MIHLKRILIVNFYEISKLPPVLSLIDVLLRNGYELSVVTFDKDKLMNRYSDKVNLYILNDDMNVPRNFVSRKIQLREVVKKAMENNDILWTTTDRTVRELGKLVYRYCHVMQLMELIEDIPYFPGQKIIKSHLECYARKAFKVVVPEYNRAHIQKALWKLDKLPVVLPNKPSNLNQFDAIPSDVEDKINKIMKMNKRLIIYQGVLRKERPLEPFAKAISNMGDGYALLIIGNDSNGEAKVLENKYSCVKSIGFVTPPYHLKITEKAYIGILTYVPEYDNKFYQSVLNPVFCAPNKLYEYAGSGLPMIGNDIPGLHYPFDKYHMGVTCNLSDVSDIEKKLNIICKNYDEYKVGCKTFYDDTNLDDIIVKQILEE